MSPSIIQGRTYFRSGAIRGARPVQEVQPWHIISWCLGERTHPPLMGAHMNRGWGVPHFLSSHHWNLKLWPRAIDELSRVTLWSRQGVDTLKWAGLGEMANSLISRERWHFDGRAVMYARSNVAAGRKVNEGFCFKWPRLASAPDFHDSALT